MISRRLLRTKALTVLYAHTRKEGQELKQADRELHHSIEKAYDLYHALLLLLLEVAEIAQHRIDLAWQKRIPSEEDLNPNLQFVDNRIIRQIENNVHLQSYLSNRKLSWAPWPELAKSLYQQLTEWPAYKEYMEAGELEYADEKKFVIRVFQELFLTSEHLDANLEEQSIYWNDDLEFILSMVVKTIKRFKEEDGEEAALMPLYRNDEDREYVKKLLHKAILNQKRYRDLIDGHTTNWEIERIALMDILVMQLALTEILEFPEIPVKVSLNEYIDISKMYCTSKSSIFVNGILDKIVQTLRSGKEIRKSGRGLIGEMENPAK